MGFPFHITEHVIDAQYVRDHARATATPDAPLKLCIKKYSPVDNPNPQPGDITFVATHGIIFPKEVYEPLWEALLARSKQDGFRIRAIWMADAVNQGASGILNEQHLGNDTTWNDHSRDVFHMISHFRAEMPRPIMGIGHSAGAVSLIFASLFHPSLFTSLLLMEPFINDLPLEGGAPMFIILATNKRDTWPSREEAAKRYRKYFASWDPRALQRWTEFGFRDLPTATYPSTTVTPPGAVTLTTTKYQEVMTLTNINYRKETVVQFPDEEGEENRVKQKSIVSGRQVYRTEPIAAFKLMPHLAPSTLIISGSESPLYLADRHTEAAKITGTGFGGSGGVAADMVRHAVIDEGTHTFPMEKIDSAAEIMGPWVQREWQRWKEDEAQVAEEWGRLSTQEKTTFPSQWVKLVDSVKAKL